MLSYADEREANIERNRQLLAALNVGKLKPAIEPKETRRNNQKKPNASNKRKADATSYVDVDEQPRAKTARVSGDEDDASQPEEGHRRSSRIAGKPADAMTRVELARGTPQPMSVKALVRDEGRQVRRHNPKTYGSIPGIEVGSWWASREECSKDAIHAPWVGGIAPGPDGAYSVALSGGYDDDIDEGYAFTYTGAGKFKLLHKHSRVKRTYIHHVGGRDLKGTKKAPKNLRTAKQSFDQSFQHNHNKALKRSVETGKPVRVIRGYKLQTKYGPSEGYRYDGLYVVKKYWQEKGLSKGGFLVCKFAFVRLPDQPPIAVKDMGEDCDEAESCESED